MLDEQNTPETDDDLDEAQVEDTAPADDAPDTDEGGEELVIAIDGEEPEDDPEAVDESELGDAGKRALRKAREAAKEAAAEARKLKAELERAKQAQAPKPEEVKRPTMEECGFDEDVYAERMASFVEAQKAVKEAEARAKAEAEAAEKDYQTRFATYDQEKAKLPPSDMEAAEAAVKAALTVQQQAIIVRNASNPAQVVLALGKSPKALAALAALKDYDRFAYALAQTEGKITVTKKPIAPESKLRAGAAGAGGVSLSKQLEEAEKRAERTGDRTEVIRLRAQMKASAAS